MIKNPKVIVLLALCMSTLPGCTPATKAKPSPAHRAYLVIPPECMQEMACKADAIIHDGKVTCSNWELRYSCTKVVK